MLSESQLTSSERSLVEAARTGAVLQTDEEIRAELIRGLLLGRYSEQLDPRGVQLSGARIVGPLDLDFARSPVRLRLSGCELDTIMTARSATLSALDLDGCQLPGLHADRLHVEGNMFLRTILGSKLASRSRDTSIATGPTSVSTVLDRVPLRELPVPRPAGSCLS